MDAARRQLFRAGLADEAVTHVASLLLQVRPASIDAVRIALDVRPHCTATVTGCRIVVVVEFADESALSDLIGELGDLPGVLSVALVYHHIEPTSALDEELVHADDAS